MRVTQILYKQHIGKGFLQQWMQKGKLQPADTGAQKILMEKNIKVYTAEEVLGLTSPQVENVKHLGLKPEPVAFDNTHPNWHDRVCLTFKDHNVLLEGLNQAKVVTKSVEVKEGLPDKVKPTECSKDIHNKVKNIILYSHLFDAEQEKLPKIKDPLRPAFNFPRVYGITDKRVNMLLISKLINLMEMKADEQMVKTRHVLNNLDFSFPFEKSGDLIQLQLRGETLLTASTPLLPISKDIIDAELPNLFPIKETVTLNRENIYELKDIYPIQKNVSKSHPHTVFVHYNGTEVKNLFEEPVTDSQIQGRCLLKAFTVAASYARQQHGVSVKKLPTPITIQCVQTDGRLFDFGIFQLNTLDLEDAEGIKNIWYQNSRLPLFQTCQYNLGKPTLVGYNEAVINQLFSFYENI